MNLKLKHLGNRALASRDYETAKKTFAALISESPDLPDGYLGMAKTLERCHDPSAVIALLEPVAGKLDSAVLMKFLGDAYGVLGTRGNNAAVDSAIRWYKAYLSKRRDAVTLYYLGEIYREHKHDYATALQLYVESWQEDPGSRTVFNAAHECAKKLGRLDEVLRLKEVWKSTGRE